MGTSNVFDKDEFTKTLDNQVRMDGFKTIMFCCEDTGGYPVGVEILVYLNWQDWQVRDKEPYMKVSFSQESIIDEYNIAENYDKIRLSVRTR